MRTSKGLHPTLAIALAVLVLSACAAPAATRAASAPPPTEAPASATAGPTAEPVATPTPAPTPTPTPSKRAWHNVAAPADAPAGAQWIAVDADDGKSLLAAVYSPKSAKDAPVLIVLSDQYGLQRAHLEVAAWLAQTGFVAVAPCWIRYTKEDAARKQVPQGISCSAEAPKRDTSPEVAQDILAVADASRTLPGARPDRVGVFGTGGGGVLAAFLAAAHGGRTDAIVAVFGTPVYACTAEVARVWGSCVPQLAERVSAPMLLVQGADDPSGQISNAHVLVTSARAAGRVASAIDVKGAAGDLITRTEFWNDDLKGRIAEFLRMHLTG